MEIRARFGEKQVALLPSYGEEVKGPGLAQVARALYEKGQQRLFQATEFCQKVM